MIFQEIFLRKNSFLIFLNSQMILPLMNRVLQNLFFQVAFRRDLLFKPKCGLCCGPLSFAVLPSKDGQTDVSTEVKSLVALLNYLDNIQREGGCSNNTFFSIQMVQLSKTTFHLEMGKPLCTTLNLFLGGLGCR